MIVLKNVNIILTGATGVIGNSILDKLVSAGANILATGTNEQKLKIIKDKHKDLNAVMVTILGITFKENIPDIRNSKVIDIYMALIKQSVKVQIYDPYFENSKLKNHHNIQNHKFLLSRNNHATF